MNLRLNVNLKIIKTDCCSLNTERDVNSHCLQKRAFFFAWEETHWRRIAVKKTTGTWKANICEGLKGSENCSKLSCLPNIAWAAFHQNAVRAALVTGLKSWVWSEFCSSFLLSYVMYADIWKTFRRNLYKYKYIKICMCIYIYLNVKMPWFLGNLEICAQATTKKVLYGRCYLVQ